jgi:hypothetical protein
MRAWDEAAPDAAPALRHKAAEVCKALLGFARRVPVGFPSAALQYARYHWRCGQRRSARRWWRRAMAAAQRLGTAHVQGLALYDMGTRLAPRDGGGLPALQQAQAIFERIGAEHDRTRVARALAAMSASTPA